LSFFRTLTLPLSKAWSHISTLPLAAKTALGFLIATNLIPLFGVLYLGWSLFLIVFIFWCENWIIGLFNVMKMAIASGGSKRTKFQPLHRLFVMSFFSFHFGMFCFGHGALLFTLFGDLSMGGESEWSEPLTLIPLPIRLILSPQSGLAIPILSLLVSHAVSFGFNYIGRGEYLKISFQEQMALPYKRIVILQVALLLGALAIDSTGNHIFTLIMLIGMKMIMDITAHLKEHSPR
jgi:hypothetical protein